MFSLITPYLRWIKAASAVLLLIGAFAGGHHLATLQERAAALKTLEAQKAVTAAKEKELAQLSSQLEVAKNAQTALTQTLSRKVDHVITRRIYQYACFDDDGLRIVNNALTGTDSGEPSPTLPTAPATR